MTDLSPSAVRPGRHLAGIGISPILQIEARAAALAQQGRPVISLCAGEPDRDTPPHIKDAAARAIRDGATKYTPLTGTAALKQAVQEKFRRDNRLDYEADEIIISSGAKQIIYNALAGTLEEGDEVLLPAPYWVSYADIIQVCGGRPVLLPCRADAGFKLDPACLAAALTPRSRWIIFNSPANPTGAVYTAEEYRALAAVLLQHPQLLILADDIYEHLIFDGRAFCTPAALDPALRRRTLTVNGVSKAYAMTGWRIGYAGGPAVLIKAMAVMQSQSTSCPSSVSQAAAIAALSGPQGSVYDMRESLQERRDFTVGQLRRMPGLSCADIHGAFYAFPSCTALSRQATAADGRPFDVWFCEQLLEREAIAAVPGSAFGLPGHFRISFAATRAQLDEALQRLRRFCAQIQG